MSTTLRSFVLCCACAAALSGCAFEPARLGLPSAEPAADGSRAGDDGTGAGAADGGGEAPDGAAPDTTTSCAGTPGAVACGASACGGARPLCCVEMGSTIEMECEATCDGAGKGALACDGPEDCGPGSVCCLDPGFPPGGLCRTACGPGEQRLCRCATDCAPGEGCTAFPLLASVTYCSS